MWTFCGFVHLMYEFIRGPKLNCASVKLKHKQQVHSILFGLSVGKMYTKIVLSDGQRFSKRTPMISFTLVFTEPNESGTKLRYPLYNVRSLRWLLFARKHNGIKWKNTETNGCILCVWIGCGNWSRNRANIFEADKFRERKL